MNKDDHDLYAEGEMRGSKYCSTSEGCVTVTWMQLSLQLLRLTGEAKYADELERSICNALLASQSPHTGEVSYFLPLNAGRRSWRSTRISCARAIFPTSGSAGSCIAVVRRSERSSRLPKRGNSAAAMKC